MKNKKEELSERIERFMKERVNKKAVDEELIFGDCNCEHCSCEDCNRYYIGANKEDVCLYDNNTINDTSICCNKYLDCFRWRKPKEN